jgi:hypothetical protein
VAPVHAAFIVPIGVHAPQVLVSLTTERHPDDIIFTVVNSSSISAPDTMPVGSAPHYEVATWDTGAPVHILSREAYGHFDVAGAGKSGAFPTPVNGIPAIASDPLGIYTGGFGTVTQTTPSLVVNTAPFMGQYNTSVLYAPAGDSMLPTVVGTPLSSQYISVYDYADPQIVTIDGKEYRSPEVTIAEFDTLPDPTRRLQLNIALGLLGDPPSFFPSLANFNDFGDDPAIPTVGPSYYLDANITHDGNSRSLLEMLYDTGTQGSFVSEQVAATLGFDVINDEPDFVVRLQTVSGTTDEVPGFFADELELPGTDGGLVRGLTPLIVFNLPDPRSPGNVLDGLIGQNVLGDRTVTFDPDPTFGLGEPPPFLGLSDPALDNHDWGSTTASASFGNASNWTSPGTPALDWIAHVQNNAAFDQTAVVSSDASVSALNVVGDAEKMTVSVDSPATLTVFGTVIVTDNGELYMNGGVVDPMAVEVRGGSLTGHGDVGGEVISRALVAPGNSAGVLHFLSNVDLLSQGTLAMELGGTDNSVPGSEQFDQVLIDGMAGLGGTLDLSLIDLSDGGNPFQPAVGDTFEIISYGSRAGRFETFNADDALGLHYTDTAVLAIAEELQAPVELTGEFDVSVALRLNGAWTWNGLVVKWGEGEMVLDLDYGFTAGPNAALEIMEGSVRLEGTGILELLGLTFGDLGEAGGELPSSFASELIVSDGVTLILDDPLVVPDGSILTVDGTLQTSILEAEGFLQGSGVITGSLVIIGGIFSPGGGGTLGSQAAGDAQIASSIAGAAPSDQVIGTPEPSSSVLLGIACLAGLMCLTRRRR